MSEIPTWLKDDGAVSFISIRVQPRAKAEAVGPEHDGALKIAVTAPPVDSAANKAVIALLAKRLNVAKRAVQIVKGETSRKKLIAVTGVSPERIAELLRW